MKPEPENDAVVLLTGATGFLGGAVAADLLERRPHVRLLCLVRARDAAEGLSRLRRSIERFAPAPDALARVTEDAVLCGDLDSFPALAADERLQSITHVLNCAAIVSFAWKHEVWATNVDQTLAFAECIAGLPAVRRVVHVSTAMISGSTADRTVCEEEFPGSVRQFTLYTKSKAEIERRLPSALNGTLVIARPSVVVGHTRVGCNASPSIFWLFRMMHAARRLPFSPLRRIDIVPVDYCARALTHLLFKNDIGHDCYHISAGPLASCSFAEIDAAYARARNPASAHCQELHIEDDLLAMETSFERWFGACDPKRTGAAIRIYKAFAALNVTFDNARLLGEGMEPPPRFADYIETCVRTGERESIAEQMSCDSR